MTSEQRDGVEAKFPMPEDFDEMDWRVNSEMSRAWLAAKRDERGDA